MINEEFLKGLIGKRVSIAVKNHPHVSGGTLESVNDTTVVLNPNRTNVTEPAKVYIAIEEIASVLVY
jgi:small nuclear ribonucleoprotein (snRNP)-like protein